MLTINTVHYLIAWLFSHLLPASSHSPLIPLAWTMEIPEMLTISSTTSCHHFMPSHHLPVASYCLSYSFPIFLTPRNKEWALFFFFTVAWFLFCSLSPQNKNFNISQILSLLLPPVVEIFPSSFNNQPLILSLYILLSFPSFRPP